VAAVGKARAHLAVLDLVVAVARQAGAKADLLEAGERIDILAAQVAAIAAQLHVGHAVLVRVIVPMLAFVIAVVMAMVVPVPAAVQMVAMRMAVRVVVAVARQAVARILVGIGNPGVAA